MYINFPQSHSGGTWISMLKMLYYSTPMYNFLLLIIWQGLYTAHVSSPSYGSLAFIVFVCLTLNLILQAISALNNVIPEGSNQPLTVRVAEEHGKQKATQFYNSTMNMNMNMMNSMHYPPPSSNVMHRGRARFRFQNMCPYWETFVFLLLSIHLKIF